MREDIGGQFVEVGALLSPCGFQRSHLGHGTWQQSLSILQSRHGWPSERDTFLRGKKKMFFKRETILIKVVRLGRWSNVFPKMILLLNGFMVGEAAGLCSLLGVVMTEPAP